MAPHMPPEWRCAFTDMGRRSARAAAPACAHGLWPTAIQSHVFLVCRFIRYHLHVNTRITTHLPTREGWKAELTYSAVSMISTSYVNIHLPTQDGRKAELA